MTRGRWTPRNIILMFVAGCVTRWVYDARIVESVWRHRDLVDAGPRPPILHVNSSTSMTGEPNANK